jgi:protein-tyrosine-phosphatase
MEPIRGDAFEILVICTGNRFRSPLVAAYLRDATKGLPVQIESAGTLDLGGLPALEGALATAHELDLDLTEHSSRFIGNVQPGRADLVLCFERMHITAAVDGGAQRERVFTLPELVSLLERFEPPNIQNVAERARVAIARANHARERDRRWRVAEVDDPIGTPPKAQRKTASELIDLTARLVTVLFGLPQDRQARSRWHERFRRRG